MEYVIGVLAIVGALTLFSFAGIALERWARGSSSTDQR